MLLSDYITQVRTLVHDTSGNAFTDTLLTSNINSARNRVALDFHCVRSFFTSLNTIVGQETYPLTGGVGGVDLTAPGMNYTAPVVTIGAPPAGGVQATAVAVLSGPAPSPLVGINMTAWGLGYVAAPSVTITDSTGTGAAGIATAFVNVYDINSITIIWGNQRIVCNYYPFTRFQAFIRANRTWQMRPGAWTIHEAAKIFFLGPVPNDVYPMEMDVLNLPNPLVSASDTDTQITLPWNDCVQFYASYLSLIGLQNYEQAEYWMKQYKRRQMEITNTSFDRRMTNVYRVGRRRFSKS